MRIELADLNVKEIEARFIPIRHCINEKPRFFHNSVEMTQIHLVDQVEQRRGHYIDVVKLFSALDRTKWYIQTAHDGVTRWIETLPPCLDVYCHREILPEILALLNPCGLEVSYSAYDNHYDPQYEVRYVDENYHDLAIAVPGCAFYHLAEGYDCVRVNVTLDLVEQDLKTPTRVLQILGALRGDGYCDFPHWTKITSQRFPLYGDLPVIADLQQHSPHFPMRELHGNVYTVLFPNSQAHFSILYYTNDLRTPMYQEAVTY